MKDLQNKVSGVFYLVLVGGFFSAILNAVL